MKNLFKNLICPVLVTCLMFPYSVFAQANPKNPLPAGFSQVEELNQKAKTLLNSKQMQKMQLFADQEKKIPINAETFSQITSVQLSHGVYGVFPVKAGSSDPAYGIKAKVSFEPSGDIKFNFRLLNHNLTTGQLEETYPLSGQEVVLNQGNSDQAQILIDQAFQSAVNSAVKSAPTGMIPGQDAVKRIVSNMIDAFFPSAEAGEKGLAKLVVFLFGLVAVLSLIQLILGVAGNNMKEARKGLSDLVWYGVLSATVYFLFVDDQK